MRDAVLLGFVGESEIRAESATECSIAALWNGSEIIMIQHDKEYIETNFKEASDEERKQSENYIDRICKDKGKSFDFDYWIKQPKEEIKKENE